jgi:hypothetical protein
MFSENRYPLFGIMLSWQCLRPAEQKSPLSELFERGGAARGIRTPDPIITNDVLYQLSYCGILQGYTGYSADEAPR